MGENIRIVLVDECEIVRGGLRSMLDSERGVKVVGDYASGDESLSRVETLVPDIVIIGSDMPGEGTIEVARRLKDKQPDCKIIVLNWSRECLTEGIEAVADHYLSKDVTCVELIRAIKQCYQGKRSLEELGFVKEVDLVIPAAADADELLGFIDHVETTLDANIQQTVGSRVLGTVITILLKPMPLADFIDRLWGMPYIDEVEDVSPSGVLSSFAGKLTGRIRTTKTSPRKRILVTLNSHAYPES